MSKTSKIDYNLERENNIIKNIALEVVLECSVEGLDVSPELANYLVKLKLLNPRNGFTASEVMPRNLTQQLVMSTVEDLKQDTPAMDCIKMQVYWNSIKMSMAELKREYTAILAEKTEPYINDILVVEKEDLSKLSRLLGSYSLIAYNLGNMYHPSHLRETSAALHSVFKSKDASAFLELADDEKIERMKTLAKRVAGIKQYLKYIGKGGEGCDDVKDLLNKLEMTKNEIQNFALKLSFKIEDIQSALLNLIPMDLFNDDVVKVEVELPPEYEMSDLIYLKKILVIMLQHSFYISDIQSKLDEIDGNVNFYLEQFNKTLQRLQETIRDREAVPTTDVYPDFEKASEIWLEIQYYSYCYDCVNEIAECLENFNKKIYFEQTPLEKAFSTSTTRDYKSQRFSLSSRITAPSSALIIADAEDFQLEFNGFCAWTLYYTDGVLVPASRTAGIFQHQDLYYAFSEKRQHELWAKDPQYYIMEIYEHLRVNPEMINLLNAYENLYSSKNQTLKKATERKIPTRTELCQTVLHPIEEYWDKDYTFSIWELKKRALTLSRMVKCVTKSVQTTNPHSHFRSSIGLLAAPDKDKEVQTKKDSSCNHPTIANYLYGLRGHREDAFRVIELTRPLDETCEREIIIEKGDPCIYRRKKIELKEKASFSDICVSQISDEKCNIVGDQDYYNIPCAEEF